MAETQSRIVLGGSSLEKLNDPNLEKFLNLAFGLGIREIDSAPTYGNLESMLGRILGDDSNWILNSKISNRSHLDFPVEGIAQQVEKSLTLLKRDRLGTVFVHSVPLHRLSEAIKSSIVSLKLDRLVNFVGYSSNSNIEDLQAAVDMPIFDKFQVTCNVLDQSNLNVICEKLEKEIYFKRVFGSGVLRTDFLDDVKLQTKILLGLKGRFDVNDYHYRFRRMFGFAPSKSKFHQVFFEYVLSLGREQRLIVGTTDPKHLRDLVQLERQAISLKPDQLVHFSTRFKELESKYGWTPYR
jgi:aryl-alcohol dehydrogenase-like predicted oxidoreductase